jgi:hypothetical protein
VFGSFNRKER